MKKLFAIVALTLPLAACNYVEIDRTKENFTILSINPPKHVYVDVVDSNGNEYTVYVSKHCNNWREIKVGTEVTLVRVKYRDEKDGPIKDKVRVENKSDVCPSR